MMAVGRLKIGGKLRLAFGSLLLVVVLCGGVGLYQVGTMNAVSEDLANNRVPSVVGIARLADTATRLRLAQASVLLNSTEAGRRAARTAIEKAVADIRTARQAYQIVIDPGEEMERLMPAVDAALGAYQRESERLDAPGLDRQTAEHIFEADLAEAFTRLTAALNVDIAYNVRQGGVGAEQSAQTFKTTVWVIGGMSLLAAVVAIGAAIWLNADVTARVVRLAVAMRQLAQRDYSFALPDAHRSDEIGDMVRALGLCRKGLQDADASAVAQAAEQEQKAARAARLEDLSGRFESEASEMIGLLSSASTDLQATAQSMSTTTGVTTERAKIVGLAANQASGNVQTVAAAVEELAASVSEISRQITQTAQASNRAATDARHTRDTVKTLADAGERIGHVVNLISDIAGQTNLLALNATIEAARAGDAGKGFAVVASEVKALASQTSKATAEIGAQVEQIQAATRAAVDAIETITGTIGEVSQTTSAVAAAVEQQGVATQDIARNIQEASAGTQEVTVNIRTVSQAAEGASASAHDVLSAAEGLSKQTATFSKEVSTFLAGICAA